MKLTHPTADLYVPDGLAIGPALARTTHLGIGAHQDDLEFMTIHGILSCFGRSDRSFCGVTCTDGAGSSRSGVYGDYTDEQMKAVRRQEQRAAAMVGRYGAMLQLDFTSKEVKARDIPRCQRSGRDSRCGPARDGVHAAPSTARYHVGRDARGDRGDPQPARCGGSATVYGCEIGVTSTCCRTPGRWCWT